MEQNDMSIINFSGLKSRPIAVSLTIIGAIIVALGAIIKPYIIQELSADFVTKAEFVVVITKLDKLISKDVRRDAYDNIGNIEGDIERHTKLKDDNSAWTETNKQLNRRLETAIAYRDCILDSKPNCNDIKDEIW